MQIFYQKLLLLAIYIFMDVPYPPYPIVAKNNFIEYRKKSIMSTPIYWGWLPPPKSYDFVPFP
jgi:hypothetical protein